MIWKIAKKEFHSNLLTVRFGAGTALLLLLAIFFCSMLIGEFRQNLADYDKTVAKNNELLNHVMTYQNLKPVLTKPPEALALFSKGIDNNIAKSIQISLEEIPTLTSASTAKNPLLAVFSILDIVLIFKLVMSILAFLLAYDAISGEKEDGTLSLMLANNLPRYQILAGKLFGGMLTLTLPMSMGFLVTILMMAISPTISLTGEEIGRVALMFLSSLAMVAVFFSLGLFISSLTRRSSDTLMILLFLWVAFLLIIPNVSSYLAFKTKPVDPLGKIRSEIQELNETFETQRRDIIIRTPAEGTYNAESGADESWGYYIQFATRGTILFYQKINEQILPLRARLTQTIGEVNQRYLNGLIAQKKWADSLCRTSPISIYEKIMSALSRTDVESLQDFGRQALQYRRLLIDYLNAKKAFSSLRYFTTIKEPPPFDVKSPEEFLALREKYSQLQPEPLDISDMPQIRYRSESLAISLKRIVPDLLLLVFMAIAFIACSFVAMLKYDVR